MGIARRLPLYVSEAIDAPMLLGLFRPCVVLPARPFSETRWGMICRHELTHYKRRDIAYKWFVQLMICLHWFNPLVYLMGREIYRNSELSCDEAVLTALDARERRRYGDVLMAQLPATRALPAALPAMSGEGSHIKERLVCIMRYSSYSPASRLLSGVLASVIIVGAVFFGVRVGGAAELPDPDNAYAFSRASLDDWLMQGDDETAPQVNLFSVSGAYTIHTGALSDGKQ